MQTTPMPDYRRLTEHLAARPHRTATLTFGELQRVVGGAVPLDAYERRDWWARTGYARAWRQAGWRLETVDVLGRMVMVVPDTP